MISDTSIRSVVASRRIPLPAEMSFRFGTGAEGNRFLVSGWCEPEEGFVWSEGRLSLIRLPALPEKNTIALSLWGYAPDSVQQEVLIFCNGLFKGHFEIHQHCVVTLTTDGMPAAEAIEISIYLPTSRSPQAVEGSTDTRRLGIALALLQQSTELV